MPTLVRTNQTKADLLQRKLEINSELRELRNHYDKPGVVEILAIGSASTSSSRGTHLGMLGVSGINAVMYTRCDTNGSRAVAQASWMLSVRSPLTGSPGPR